MPDTFLDLLQFLKQYIVRFINKTRKNVLLINLIQDTFLPNFASQLNVSGQGWLDSCTGKLHASTD